MMIHTALEKPTFDKYNPIFMMADLGAVVVSARFFSQVRGLIANTSGTNIEIPIRAIHREGLNILEYFISSRGACIGMPIPPFKMGRDQVTLQDVW